MIGDAQLADAFHRSFTDMCEVPGAFQTLAPPVGPKPDCGPEALPWRLARYLTNYLALSFFDATLNGSPEALARLDPAQLAAAPELSLQRKSCASQSCEAVCQLPCGNGSLEPFEACDLPGEEGLCAEGALCNDNCTACVTCDDATLVPAAGGVLTGTTVGAASALGSSCGGDFSAPEQIFAWTPSTSHVATLRTTGRTTDYDTTLYVREESCLSADVACNDDAVPGTFQSSVTLPVVAGTRYFIVVDGFGVEAGSFTLSVDVAN